MILVTGGAGFIGSNLIQALNGLEFEDIMVVDNLGRSSQFLNLNDLKFTQFYQADDFLEQLSSMEKPDFIFHQGACTNTLERDSVLMLKKNYHFSCALLEYAQFHKIPFVYASSAAVYGNGENGYKENPQCESPINIYAFSKQLFDRKVRQAIPKSQSPIIGLRYFNVYGPRENHKKAMASVIFQFAKQLKSQGFYNLFAGSDKILRDFIHVNDVVEVNLHFMKSPQSGIYNVGTGQARSFALLADIIDQNWPSALRNEIEFPQSIRSQYQFHTCADISKLRSSGFENEFISLEQGASKYICQLKDLDFV